MASARAKDVGLAPFPGVTVSWWSSMFDHVTIRVRDRAASQSFYATVLSQLGLEANDGNPAFAAWREFLVTGADEQHHPTTRLHVGFVAPSREHVDAFWQAGTDAGYPSQGPPGPRPQYREDYYGAFLRDPDGNNVEAVHHGALRSDGGAIDHIWIRVLDLPAARSFYRTLAAAAGLTMRDVDGDRATLSNAAKGGSLTLVSGAPTANVHMAFPGTDEAVQRFYSDAVEAGHRGNGEPGERPRYHPGYYAAFVLDPDGNNIEVVDHHTS